MLVCLLKGSVFFPPNGKQRRSGKIDLASLQCPHILSGAEHRTRPGANAKDSMRGIEGGGRCAMGKDIANTPGFTSVIRFCRLSRTRGLIRWRSHDCSTRPRGRIVQSSRGVPRCFEDRRPFRGRGVRLGTGALPNLQYGGVIKPD